MDDWALVAATTRKDPPVHRRLALAAIIGASVLLAAPAGAQETPLPSPAFENYEAGAGAMVDGVWRVHLTARRVTWQPRGGGTPAVPVHAFSADDGTPGVPGPMIRVQAGTPVEVTVSNELHKTVVLRGLRDRNTSSASPDETPTGFPGLPIDPAFWDESLRLAPGETRSVRFTPTVPGSFLYYGRTLPQYGPIPEASLGGEGPDGPFMGPIIVDAPGEGPEPNEQVLLITRWADVQIDPGSWRTSWKMMINGRSWPATQRLTYTAGDTVTWRVINASLAAHPMHLHGFYFQVHARGDQSADTTYAPEDRRTAVTEWLDGVGQSMRIQWVASEPGNWLFHCHLVRHMSGTQRMTGEPDPDPEHSFENHAMEGMAGMVMGIHVRPSPDAEGAPALPTQRRIDLYTSRRSNVIGDEPAFSFVTAEGDVPALDSLRIPGSPLILKRDEMTEIVVHNRLDFPFGVHWHGLELESRYDGVADWSGSPGATTPPIPPGDSLFFRIAPPRAGTFIYHVHSEPGHQLAQGMYGPFLVLEPGDEYDPDSDRVFLLASEGTVPNEQRPVVNGAKDPDPMELRAGTRYRLRFINMSTDDLKRVRLLRNDTPARWRFVAKDGADLPPSQIVEGPAVLDRMGVGETFDYTWTPSAPGLYTLEITTEFYAASPQRPETTTVRIQVR
jgi:FtsP/CotA-like multicopper oxidase with cupredoxin domain